MVDSTEIFSPSLAEIRNILATIPDPEIPVVSIEELGMVQKVELNGEQVTVTITPTYSGCPATDFIRSSIEETLKAKGYIEVVVELSYSPAWSSTALSAETKRKLKQYGIAPPQHCCGNEVCAAASCSRITCPRCNSKHTKLISDFGSTACKALYSCQDCKEPFEYFKVLE